MNKSDKIFVAGHTGMVGSAVVRNLQAKGYTNVLTVNRAALDLTTQQDVLDWFSNHTPHVVIDCAAKVGGIHSNNIYRADFIHQNLQIQNNLPKYLQEGKTSDDLKRFLNLNGEHYDLIRSHIDNYLSFNKRNYNQLDSVPTNLMEILASNLGWELIQPFNQN